MYNRPLIPTLAIALCVFFHGQAQTSNNADSLLKTLPAVPDTLKAKRLLDIGGVFNLKGMRDSAFYYFNQALEAARKVDNSNDVCKAYFTMGHNYMHQQRYTEAFDMLFNAIDIGDKNGIWRYSSMAKNDVGIIYDSQDRPAEALKYLREAEDTMLHNNWIGGLATLYQEMITCFAKLKDTAGALDYFKKGLAICLQYEESPKFTAAQKDHLPLIRMALIFNAVGVMNKEQDLLLAINEIKKVNDKVVKGDNDYEKFSVNTLFATTYLKLKNYKEAQFYGIEAEKYARPEGGNFDQLTDLYRALSQASASLGDYAKAYQAQEKFRIYNDSVYKVKSLDALNAASAKYETEKKEARIAALNKEKRVQNYFTSAAIAGMIVLLIVLILAFRSNRLKQKLLIKEKEIQKKELEQKMAELEQTALRAQMNPHFIFNSLNSVQRFVIKNDIEGVNTYLSAFASLIRQTLENSGRPLITLREELLYLDTYLRLEQMRSADLFNYGVNVSDKVDTGNIFIPNMIVQPFIENSILHGTKNSQGEKARIDLTFTMNGKLVCTIEDNGEGFRKNAGVIPTHQPMGSQITRKRIDMYNSLHEEKIDVKILDKGELYPQDHGTKVILEFPLSA